MSSDGDDLAMICTPSKCITSGHSIVSKTISHLCKGPTCRVAHWSLVSQTFPNLCETRLHMIDASTPQLTLRLLLWL